MSIRTVKLSDYYKRYFITLEDDGTASILKADETLPSLKEVQRLRDVCIAYLEELSSVEIQRLNEKLKQEDQEQRVKEQEQFKPEEKNGVVYLMQNHRNDYIKIGFTTNRPEFREKTLQSEEPEISLFKTFSGTIKDEQFLHKRFKKKRLRGEWFCLDCNDLNLIAKYFKGLQFIE